jgi:hypothetical protein
MAEYTVAAFGDRDIAANVAQQAVGAWLAAHWVPAWHGWSEDGDQLTVTVRLTRRTKPFAPEPAPEPPPQKRYCWECRWGMLSKAADQCWAPALCGEDYVRGAKQPQLGCPANATGDCPHWEAKDGTH